jgi:DNA-binding NarL/FixJ family response regulator
MNPSKDTTISASKRTREQRIVVIDSRTLERECFVKAVASVQPKTIVEGFASVAGWANSTGANECDAVLYNVEGRRLSEGRAAGDVGALAKAAPPVPIMVLSPFEELSEMIAALDAGASGYIPASLGIGATLIAVRLAAAGAIFLPVKTVLAMRDRAAVSSLPAVQDYFTPRQASVADALRRGKSNKVIAYELSMCESTVKVHIRNIMKKLSASNRTEAGFKLHSLLSNMPANERRDHTGPFRVVR